MKKQGIAPKRIITDKLPSYGAAKSQVMPGVEHRSHKGLNNRAENSHLPLRKRERMMQGFRSAGGLQRFTSVFSAVRNLFVLPHSNRVCPRHPPSPPPGHGSVERRGRRARLKPAERGLLRSPQVYVTSPWVHLNQSLRTTTIGWFPSQRLCCMDRIVHALNAPVDRIQAMRTDFGHPSSSMRFRA